MFDLDRWRWHGSLPSVDMSGQASLARRGSASERVRLCVIQLPAQYAQLQHHTDPPGLESKCSDPIAVLRSQRVTDGST